MDQFERDERRFKWQCRVLVAAFFLTFLAFAIVSR